MRSLKIFVFFIIACLSFQSHAIHVLKEDEVIPYTLSRLQKEARDFHLMREVDNWEVCGETLFCEHTDNVISKRTKEPFTGIAIQFNTFEGLKYIAWQAEYNNGKRDGICQEYVLGKRTHEKKYKNGQLLLKSK